MVQRHFIDEHFITFMKKARKGDFPGLFHMLRKESGKGGKPFLKKGFPSLPRTPSLLSSRLLTLSNPC